VSGRPQFLQQQSKVSRGAGVTFSIGLHVTCLVGVLAISQTAAEHTPRPRTSLTFAPVSLAVPVGALPPRIERAPLAIRPIEPLKPHPPTPVDDAPRVEPPAPVAPKPVVETADAELPPPPSNDIAVANAPKIPEPAVRVGAFDTVAANRPRTRETAAVVMAGFGEASARGTVRAVPTAVVGSAGFDRDTAPPPPIAVRPASDSAFSDSSIEILFKPKPLYTSEAEALGIQGTVVLEVEFTASNDVRVLRVVRTLGHGLDEAAIRAAEQIRFKPARRQGVAVDSRVTVQIEFRLT
jgi:TonB family protein